MDPMPRSTPCHSLVELVHDRIATHGLEQIVVVGEPGDDIVQELAHGPQPVTWIGQRRSASVPARVQSHPGSGPQALAELRGRLPRNTLYVLCGNGLDQDHVRQSLYMLSRGEGVLLIPLGHALGPTSYDEVRDQLLLWCPEHRLDVVLAGPQQAALVVAPRRRVHVTFVMERYTDRYGASALSINFDNMIATLAASGLAEHDILLHDEFHHEGRAFTDDDLCPPADADEHVIVLTYNFVDDANPPIALLERARARGSKVVYLWLDKHLRNPKPGYAEVADLNVIFDCTDFELPRSWPCFTTKNPMFFNDPGMVRDLVKLERSHMLQFAGFLRQLREKKDAHDRPLIDSTIVLLGTGMGDASRHSNQNLPTLVAGGGFQHGSHIAIDRNAAGAPLLGDLYVTLMQRLGMETGTFSNATRNMNQLFR